MKRFAAFLLTLLLVFTLCSCGKKHVEEQTVPPAVEDQTGEEKQPNKPIPEVTKPEDTEEPVTDGKTTPVQPVAPAVPAKPADSGENTGTGTGGGGSHHGGGSTAKNLTITGEKSVSGGTYKDVIIDESVGDGTVTLENMTINGRLIIQGGGSNSVKVKNSKVKEVKLDKDTSAGGEAPRLELTGTQVKTVEVAKPAIIEARDAVSEVKTLSAKDDVTIKGEETKVQNVTVPTEAKENVKLTVNDAAVEKVEVNKAVVIETNAAMGKTPVKNVEAKANVTVTGAATNVGKVTVPKEAENAVKLTVTDAKVAEVSAEKPVTIEANENASKIEKVEALDTVTVQGDTQIDKVEAKAPVTVDGAKTRIETITVPKELDTTPEIKVTAGSVNTVKADGKAKVSGTAANAITNVEAAASVEVASTAVAKVTVVNVTVSVTVNGSSTGTSTVEVAVEVKTSGNETVAIKTNNNVTVTVSTTKEIAPTVAVDDEIIDHIHTWNAGTVQTAASCDTAGSMLYTCTSGSCNTTKTETIPALGHIYGTPVYTWDGTQCTAKRVCTRSNCTHKETEIVTAATAVTQNKTCTLDELSTYTATFANSAFTTQTKTDVKTADKLGHSFTDYVSDNNATCTADGTKTAKCDRCDATDTVADTGSKLGHRFSEDWTHDATYHWHTATCEHTTEVSGKAVHSFGDWNNGKHTCTVCDYEETCAHEWNEGVVTTQPTCTEKGVKTYTCSVCGATRTEDVAVVAHTVSKVSGQAATCEENGWTDYYKCSECQKLFSDADCKNEITNLGVWKTGSGKLPALGHAYGTTPTWNWTDYTSATATFTCTRGCGHTETVNATISSKVTTAAGCETTGVRTYTATVSFGGQSYTNTKTADISAAGHTGVKQNGQAATCEENGWNDYYECSKCRKLFSDENCTSAITDLTAWKNSDGKLPALGHDWAEAWNRDAAGHWHVCRRQGCNATSAKENHVPGAAATENTAQTCTACGYELAPATGHLCVNHLTKTDAVAATCTQPGNSAYWSCTCGKYYSDANAENKIEKGSWILPVIDHTFNQEKAEETYLKDAATCTAKAVYYKSCTCGAKGTETFEYGSALGHSFTNYVSDNNATCTADGTKTAKCDRCDVTDTVADTDSRLGHSFTTKASAEKLSDATCTAKAVYKVQCDRCDAVSDSVTVEVGEVNLNNHTGTPGEWQTDSSKHWKEYSCCHARINEAAHSGGTATCKNKAVCAVCNAEYGELNQNNHSYGEISYVWNGTQCTATRVCANEGSHVETETVDGVYTVVTEPTYTAAGSAVYKATFTNTAFAGQTSEAVTIPATPFKVGENTYATYEEALSAAHEVGLKPTQFANIQYQVYPTIEIYGSYTVESELHLATATSIVVKNGGSLTVGTLTMEPGTMNGWWLDAGTLRLEQGSSFSLGGVQYTGTNGAFAMGDDESYIELAGRAPDMGGNNYVAVFNGNITQQNTFTMGSSYMFFNEQNSVLTVKGTLTNNAYVDNRGAILIDGGTLTNKATIDNESGIIPDAVGSINIKNEGTLTNESGARITGGNIDAFGSTVTNAGTIRVGDNCALVIENGSTLNNTGKIAGGKGSEINIGDYIYAGETATVTNIVTGINNSEAVTVPVMKAAAVFDMSKLQDALNTYDYVVPCGTSTTVTNTVTLGDLTVPKGKLLILKETVNDGANRYHNKFVLNGHITIEKDTAEKDPHNGNLVTVGNPDVTVNGCIDARGFIAFDTLTIANDGYVYVENERMIVSTALTVARGGTLEIGSGSQMYYRGKTDAVINGTLIETVRNMSGFVNQVRSDIQGKGMTPNATLTTLVITEDTILHGNYTVDTVIPVKIEFVNKEGENVTLTPTLRVGANSSLKFKELYTGEGGTADQIIGLTGTEGDYTVSPVDVIVTKVASATDFLAALDDPTVTDIAITEDITLTYADNLWNHPVTKAVTVAKGVTLEVKPYTPGTDGPAEPGMKFNGLVIAANGSLTLDKGWLGGNKAILKTGTITSGEENKMWYEYRSQVNVNGGILDAEDGVLKTDSTGNIDFEAGNGQLLLPGTVNHYLITYTVDSKEELLAANGDAHCNNILLKSDVVLMEDYTVSKVLTVMSDEEHMYRLTVGSGKKLTVPENVILYVNGEVRVEGTLVNNGTITGEGFIDVMGGTLNNGGTLDLSGDIGVERGATLQNSGSVASNTSFTLADYWYSDGKKETYVLAEGTTLNDLGDKAAVMAVVFSPEQVQSALGEEKYGMVMACGEDDESTVELSNITVPADKALLLKDYVDAGERTIHNAYRLENITFGQDAGIVIMGDPDIYIIGEFDINSVQVDGNPTIYGDGFVHNAEELQEALKNGGDIYLYPFAMEDRHKEEFTFEDGHTEEVYETQYWIDTTAIATNTNLNKMGGEDPMAVFFKNGFTVNEGVTLQLYGLNVVAAANSTVGGRVEAYDGILVVQGPDDTTLTINEGGIVKVGSPEEWGALAIFDNGIGNRIINNGEIWGFGEIIALDEMQRAGQFTGNQPCWFANYADVVRDLYRDFGEMPNMDPLEDNDREDLVDVYPDSKEMYHEDGNDDGALDGFAWLIKNGIIDAYDEDNNSELRPYHYVTKTEVKDLFTAFACKVLEDDTITLDVSADNGFLCRTDNIPVENEDRCTSERNQYFDTLCRALYGDPVVTVDSEDAFLAALDNPYVTEIHVTGNIILRGRYYKDGKRVASAGETDDKCLAVYLWGSGRDQNQWRKIIVAHGVKLTLAENVKMDVQPSVELWLTDENGNGQLVLGNGSGLNVFGGLKPDGWDNEGNQYVIKGENSYINFFPDVMEFTKRLGERLDIATDTDIEVYQKQAEEWPGGDERVRYFAALVKYDTLQPRKEGEGNDFRMVWRPYDKVQYNEAMNILDNLWKDLFKNETMPAGICLDGAASDEWLDDDRVDRLIDLFEKFVQAKDSDAVMVDSIAALTAALPNGGDIYLLPNENADGKGADRVVMFTEKLTVSSDTNLISMGSEPLYLGGGLTVDMGKKLTLRDGTTMVLASDSNINGTMEIGENCFAMVRTPDEAGEGVTTKLTIAEGGKLIIRDKGGLGFPDTENNRGKVVNNGDIEQFGGFWVDCNDSNQFTGNRPYTPKEEINGNVTLTIQRDKEQDKTFIFMNNKQDPLGGDMIKNVQFNGPVTIVCDPSQLNGDSFGGDIEFRNCAFAKGVTARLGGANYNVRLYEGCTGSFTVTAENESAGSNVSFFGDLSGVTVNGLTISGMNDSWEDWEYGVNVRYDECGVNQYIPTVEVRNNRQSSATGGGNGQGAVGMGVQSNNRISISTGNGTYSGKLRIGGNIDVSGVHMAGSGMIELCNEPGYANIALGGNSITVNDDCGGDYHFTGSGTIYVPGGNDRAQITVNAGRMLANPHVFGNGGSYGIFLGLADTGGVEFEVKQGNQVLKGYSPRVIEETGGNKKTHLESAASTSDLWINHPGDITLTVKVTNGCTVVYDKLWYKDAQVVDQTATG